MSAPKKDIIDQLHQELLLLQGFKPATADTPVIGCSIIEAAFPRGCFPVGAIHEFISSGMEDATATRGFVAGILGALMCSGGAAIWIGTERTVFPVALKQFGVEPDRVIFVDLKKERDVLWTIEEALKCKGLACVIGEMKELNFTDSRRLQLAVERSGVTGLMLRHSPRAFHPTACVARWKISSIPANALDPLPGVGFPTWKVELLKVRHGKTGSWDIAWHAGQFRQISPVTTVMDVEKRKRV